jgi:predicted ATPase with chaperone activity
MAVLNELNAAMLGSFHEPERAVNSRPVTAPHGSVSTEALHAGGASFNRAAVWPWSLACETKLFRKPAGRSSGRQP